MGFKTRKVPTNEELVSLLRQTIGPRQGMLEKRMFGGVAFLLSGKMTVGVNGDSLMVRVREADFEEALSQPNARPMDFTGRPLKGFVYVSEEGWRNGRERARWVKHGIRCAEEILVAN